MILPEWVDIPNLGVRLNGLFKQSWMLLNEIADETDLDELADMWDEAIALEKNISNQLFTDMQARKNV
ncbi:hypothetical protein GS982_01755 [Rhodococcus hoagii]|uniref:Uncharacterized protein n=1 Tax=Rhodococcus hoagii TaxID=43767 RepID=A0A9Q4ZIR9_RHOHA|nr:hypothetical protein [Prescottella equi]NKT77323.1 hypothetical protein [Prescottella equi]NKZ81110.1 hypothetical protein [Prescottella equi]